MPTTKKKRSVIPGQPQLRTLDIERRVALLEQEMAAVHAELGDLRITVNELRVVTGQIEGHTTRTSTLVTEMQGELRQQGRAQERQTRLLEMLVRHTVAGVPLTQSDVAVAVPGLSTIPHDAPTPPTGIPRPFREPDEP